MRSVHGFMRRAPLAACATLLAMLVGDGGCASPALSVASTPPVRPTIVELINLSDCEWRVTLVEAGGRDRRTAQLTARGTTRLDLAAGDYAITQTALTGFIGPAPSRQFSTHLQAGETYRWPLGTLLTTSSADRQP